MIWILFLFGRFWRKALLGNLQKKEKEKKKHELGSDFECQKGCKCYA